MLHVESTLLLQLSYSPFKGPLLSLDTKRTITKTRLFKYIENSTPKTEKFQIKNSDIFHISAQNIDCWYLLEPPQ